MAFTPLRYGSNNDVNNVVKNKKTEKKKKKTGAGNGAVDVRFFLFTPFILRRFSEAFTGSSS